MLRPFVVQVVLGVVVGLAGVVVTEAPADARPGAGPRRTARRILRPKEHRLQGHARHNQRQLHREQRQLKHVKRNLKTLRPPVRWTVHPKK